MKEFIEKLIKRLNEKSKWVAYGNRDRDIGMTHKVVPFSDISDIVNELAEEHKGGWIPCSERLPEDCSDVICTTHLKGYAVMNVVVLWYNAKLRKWMNCDDEVVDDNLEVIAWQPLPEPYKEEGGENDNN